MRGEEDMACVLFLRVHLVICCVSAVRKDGFQTLRPRRLDERPRRIGGPLGGGMPLMMIL